MATTVITKSSISIQSTYYSASSLGAGTTTIYTVPSGSYLDIHATEVTSSSTGAAILKFEFPNGTTFKTITGTTSTQVIADYNVGGAIRCPAGTIIVAVTVGGAGTNAISIFGIQYTNS